MHKRDAYASPKNKQDACATRVGTHNRDACATSAVPRKWRVLVVDDFDSVRRGIYWELKRTPDLECCGEAGSVAEALAVLPTLKPDVVVLDLVFKNGAHGLSLLRHLRTQKSKLPVIVFTGYGDYAYYTLAKTCGARGVVTKEADQGIPALIPALRRVLTGETVMPPRWVNWVIQRIGNGDRQPGTSPVELLTPREMEVFEMVAVGLDVKEIALACAVDIKTAEQHLRRIREKLNLPNYAALVRTALRWLENAMNMDRSLRNESAPEISALPEEAEESEELVLAGA